MLLYLAINYWSLNEWTFLRACAHLSLIASTSTAVATLYLSLTYSKIIKYNN